MPESDNLAKLRVNTATQIEWSLRINVPAQRLLDKTDGMHGGTKLRTVKAATRTSVLSRHRVLRESASEVKELEKAAGLTYRQINERLKRRQKTTKIGSILSASALPDHWTCLPRLDVEPALSAFGDCCAALSLPDGVANSAECVLEFLTSVTGRQIGDLSHLQDMDLTDWRADHGVLRNVLRKLGNPADWIQTWLDAGIPYNVHSGSYYTNFYSLFSLRAAAAARQFPNNLWASRRQWASKGYGVVEGSVGAPVFHYFTAPEPDGAVLLEPGRRTQGPLRRISVVFNAAQVRHENDDRPFRLNPLVHKRGDVDECISRLGAKVGHRSVSNPFYDPVEDTITMPRKTWFRSRGEQATIDYYATLLHELVHWTGHPSRLRRIFEADDDADYRFEELVAELGSGFLSARFGLTNPRRLTADRHGLVAYINHWPDAGNDPVDLLLDAAGQANRASNYVLYEGDASR